MNYESNDHLYVKVVVLISSTEHFSIFQLLFWLRLCCFGSLSPLSEGLFQPPVFQVNSLYATLPRTKQHTDKI